LNIVEKNIETEKAVIIPNHSSREKGLDVPKTKERANSGEVNLIYSRASLLFSE